MSSKRPCDSRTARIARRNRRALPYDRPQSLSALAFAPARAQRQTWSGKPGRGGGKCRPVPTPAPSSHRSRISSVGQPIQRADSGAHGQVGNVQIFGGGLEVAMSQQQLDAAQVDLVFQQMGREAMAQGMRRYALGQVSRFARLLADSPDRLAADWVLR